MFALWPLLHRVLMSAALLSALIVSPAWARTPTQHPAGSAHSREIVIRNQTHARIPHGRVRQRRPVVRRKAPSTHPAPQNTSHPHLRRQMTHHSAPKLNAHRAAANERPLIVIDPGHGGKDPGAIGLSGTLEKNVTLAAALDLKHLLEATGRYRVAMTRTRDVFVSLASRVAFARSHDASLVIAIHANASKDKRAHGASVWIRSGRGVGNAVTHVAADPKDTANIADALVGPRPEPKPDSAWLQYTMIDNLDDDIRMDAAPARAAHFYVLGLKDTPSALLEMGFLSNRHDEALLKQAKYRRVMTLAIRDAINDYFSELKHPRALPT
jgi:N-acetylmuramoyl-L-alanine amidase